MTLEEYIADLNSLAFWREFTFAKNTFSPQPHQELELADNLIWFGNRAYVLQLKQRDNPSTDPATEGNWFRKKVIKKATSQIRDSLRYLEDNARIRITNQQGHTFEIQRANLITITKIVVFSPGHALPETCWQTHYHLSQTSGDFIHIIAVSDYLGILEKLRVPEDIARYFSFREKVTPALRKSGIIVSEADIMGAFLNDDDMPTPQSHATLYKFIQDLDSFDISSILGNLHAHIDQSKNPYGYYSILREFPLVPRSVWREVKVRFMKSFEASSEKRFSLPYRLSFPESDCTFMIAPLDPQLPATGIEGERIRITGLQNFTSAAKHLAQTSKAIGILISRDSDFVQIDWCMSEHKWQPNFELDEWLAKSNPFRDVRERFVDSFLFNDPSTPG